MSVDNNQTSKAFPYSSFIPFYFNGLGISNDATTPNSIVDIAPGSCLDSTGTFQMTLPAAIKISSLSNGLNGLDTGAVAASKVYAIYLISDPVTQQPTGAMISLSLTGPLMPFSYSAWSRIGYITTDSSKNFLLGYWSDNDSALRYFAYDAPQASPITAGTSTSYANVNLITLVPNFNNILVNVQTNYTPNAASDTLKLQPGNGTGDGARTCPGGAGARRSLARAVAAGGA